MDHLKHLLSVVDQQDPRWDVSAPLAIAQQLARIAGVLEQSVEIAQKTLDRINEIK